MLQFVAGDVVAGTWSPYTSGRRNGDQEGVRTLNAAGGTHSTPVGAKWDGGDPRSDVVLAVTVGQTWDSRGER